MMHRRVIYLSADDSKFVEQVDILGKDCRLQSWTSDSSQSEEEVAEYFGSIRSGTSFRQIAFLAVWKDMALVVEVAKHYKIGSVTKSAVGEEEEAKASPDLAVVDGLTREAEARGYSDPLDPW